MFGNQLILPNVQVKKATVLLNPAACKGKARTLFEKNAVPILHLSGMDVTIVKTDHEGQAKKLVELMENRRQHCCRRRRDIAGGYYWSSSKGR